SPVLRSALDPELMSRELAPAEYVATMRGVGAMLAMRFHSLVFASTLGIPAVAVDYTFGGKTYALAKHLECPIFRLDQITAGDLKNSLALALASPGSTPMAIAFPGVLRSALESIPVRQASTT